MNKIILGIIIILFFITGCGHHTFYYIFTDKGTDAHFVRMRGNKLSGGICLIELDAQRFEKKDQVSYSLFIVYAGPFFINIKSGKSLVLIIDDQRHEISGKGSESHRNIVSPGLVEEKAYYHDIEPDFMRKLAYAKKIEVEVIGSTDVIKRYFEEKNLSNLKEFYNHYTDTVVVASHNF
ncbi:MAG: hypothetical protein ABSC14_02360 [Desulfomonilia bacterium]|jgi:hypothetical protein